MGIDNEILIVVRARNEAAATLKKVREDVEKFGDGVGRFLGEATQQASLIAVGGLAAVGAAAVSAVKSFMESEDAIAQTNAVLQSTKSAAGVAANEITRLANSYQLSTKFSDEVVRSGENMLLTFTSIGKDVFPQATETMLDMSQALGQDVKNSAIQLGKALNDPIAGVSALRRVGVQFTDSQQEQIKTLVESGKKMEAQKFILKELQTEFGGSARAAGKTFGGQLTILGNRIDEVKETIGEMIIERLKPLIDWFDKVVFTDKNVEKAFVTLEGALDTAGKTLDFLGRTVTQFLNDHPAVLTFLEKWGLTALAVIPALAGIVGAIAILTNPLVLLTGALALMWHLWEDNRVLFWVVIGVLAPLAAAFVVLRAAMLIGDVVLVAKSALMLMNTAVTILTGTNIVAAASAGGLEGAIKGVQAAVAVGLGPLTLVVVGIVAIMAAVDWVNKLKAAWDGANDAAAYGDKLEDDFIRKTRANPNLSTAEKNRRIQNVTGGARAEGGPVKAGESYIVGEKQAEIFVPRRDGYILPSTDMAGKGTTIYQTNNIYNQTDLELANRELGWRLAVA